MTLPYLCAIGLGSNLGDRRENLQRAIHALADLGEVRAISSFYATEPVGYTDQPEFLNMAALLVTPNPPQALLPMLLGIERAMGRDRAASPPQGPRVIDLDLLLAQDDDGEPIVIDSPELQLPHPRLAERRFVLEPLAEIAPEMREPRTGKSVIELLIACTDQAAVRRS